MTFAYMSKQTKLTAVSYVLAFPIVHNSQEQVEFFKVLNC